MRVLTVAESRDRDVLSAAVVMGKRRARGRVDDWRQSLRSHIIQKLEKPW